MATAAVRITWDGSAYDSLMHSDSGEVAKFLSQVGLQVAVMARRLAPVSHDGSHGRPAGYMRSKIAHVVSKDSEGLHCDVISPALTPEGYPYPLGVEVGTKPHTITSRGDYPLRTKQGRVLGHSVHHPGTAPHPYLRPALEEIGNIIK